MCGRLFPKIAQQRGAQAAFGVRIKGHLPQAVFIPLAQLRCLFFSKVAAYITVLNQKAVGGDVPFAVKQQALCLVAIPPRAPGLLIIAFNVFWHIIVYHKGDI